MMYRLLMALMFTALASFTIAWAGDLDDNNVVREEHKAAAQSERDTTSHRDTRESKDVLTAEQSQDIISARVRDMENGGGPTNLELDSLGLYFGLGQQFIDMANGVITERQGSYMENGSYPVFSRLGDTDFTDLSAEGEDGHRHNTDDSDSSENDHDFGLNRRGPDHDYFYD
jgi:hypothetical protein